MDVLPLSALELVQIVRSNKRCGMHNVVVHSITYYRQYFVAFQITYYYYIYAIHVFLSKKLIYKKRVLGLSKYLETLVPCSRKIKKWYNANLSKKEDIDLLSLVNLYDFCLEKIIT